MTRKCVSDENYGNLQRKLGELARRIDEGTLEYGSNLKMLQMAIEGKLFDHVKKGGLMLSRPMSVDVSMEALPRRLQRPSCSMGVREEEIPELFQGYHASPKRISIQIAHFDFFGEQQPGTREIVKRLHVAGYRQARALELYCATQQHKLKPSTEPEYILALSTDHPNHKKILEYKYDFAIGACFEVTERNQPWWPYCYRFAVVKNEDAQSKS